MPNDPKQKPPQKKYFDVILNVDVPATLTWRVLAEDPEEAAEQVERIRRNTAPNSVQYELPRHRGNKLTVRDAGTILIRLVKGLMN